jgi:hypothetical protein
LREYIFRAGSCRSMPVGLRVNAGGGGMMFPLVQRFWTGLLCLAIHSAGLAAQTQGGPPSEDRFFSADSVADALVHYLEFRRSAGLTSPVVEFCDPLVTSDVLAAIRKRLDATTWLEVSRTESCGRPARLDVGDANYVLVVGPIGFSSAGATIVASRWHLRTRQPEAAQVSRQWWTTTELTLFSQNHSTLIPRQPPPD